MKLVASNEQEYRELVRVLESHQADFRTLSKPLARRIVIEVQSPLTDTITNQIIAIKSKKSPSL